MTLCCSVRQRSLEIQAMYVFNFESGRLSVPGSEHQVAAIEILKPEL
jgi:hypothetical protein